MASNIFHVHGKNINVVVDFYSKFPKVENVPGMTPESTINALKAIFVQNGISDLLISDNAKQFYSNQFHTICRESEFEQIPVVLDFLKAMCKYSVLYKQSKYDKIMCICW